MDDFIGISEDRLHHIIGVSRKAYQIAKAKGYNEDFARKCFMLGWLHDVGYEFSKTQLEHSYVSADLMKLVLGKSERNSKEIDAVEKHGLYVDEETVEWVILNLADMLVSSEGKEITVSERLEGIKNKYGEFSDQYLTSRDICYQIGLVNINN